uniref:Uncharacterized protein n=1 Tax=Percolomonas cosmopolitus TaxID=63605 RepID=A0A7S1KLV5_9EUKA|mmetsp:Transcript_10431/g.38746  ORF Transcript_10431/g.38746 Transcript_10431/m.38746 type:complete len:125 (+) Transcript_10431:428-802(+)
MSKVEWKMESATKGYVHFSSVGQSEENKKFYFDAQKDLWIPAPGDEAIDYIDSADFVWRPVAKKDLTKEESWPVEPNKNMNPFHNPHVSPRNVFKLYIQSILSDEEEEKERKEREKEEKDESAE